MSQTIPNAKLDRSHIAPVKTREELIYLLSRAAELEHGLACIYLFAAYSLKNDVSEGGMTFEQAEMVRSWRRHLSLVAVEEMGHLAQVSNLLTAIGGAPHFRRPNFPLPPSEFPFGIRLSLEPFSQETIERFVCYEMPESGILSAEEQAPFDALRERVLGAQRSMQAYWQEEEQDDEGCEPFEIDFKSVGEFYHKIETGFLHIPEEELFIGPPEAQANARFVDLRGDLISIVDRASACAAIEAIVEQGEAPTSAHPDAHFWVFNEIRRHYAEAVVQGQQSGVPFEPVRPVISNPMTRFYDDTSGGTVIGDPLTHEVADLFNGAYDTMLLILSLIPMVHGWRRSSVPCGPVPPARSVTRSTAGKPATRSTRNAHPQSRSPGTARTGSLAAFPSRMGKATMNRAIRAPRWSTTASVAAGTPRTSRSAAGCTGMSTFMTR